VWNVGQERAERDDEVDAKLGQELDDHVGERAPAEVRLHPEEQDDVPVEPGRAGVVEDRCRPVDLSRQALLEGDMGTGGLEVEEVLRVDLCEALCIPELREVAGGK
jgi:hypothetical protein